MLHLAILGDVVESRKASDRPGLQARLKDVLAEVAGRAPDPALRVAGPEITGGDEFQVLLAAGAGAVGASALAFLRELTEDLRPFRLTFGLGLGEISTGPVTTVREADGPCFHRAREAIVHAKRTGRWAVVAGAPAGAGQVANALLRLAGETRNGWTDRQVEIVRAHRTRPLRKDVAAALGVSPSVVTESLKAARFDAVREADDAVAALLDRAGEEGNRG
jgi:hypothetical protein